MRALFPVFLLLEGKPVLLVGGGRIAAGRLSSLLDASAEVTVVAPAVQPEIERSGVRIHRRRFKVGDLAGVWFVVAAATPEVNRKVARAAGARRVFVNAVDDPGAASAYTGGLFRRGGVTVALSTEGAAPALAGLLREGLEALLPEDVGRWVEAARAARPGWRARGVPLGERRPLLLRELNRLYEGRVT